MVASDGSIVVHNVAELRGEILPAFRATQPYKQRGIFRHRAIYLKSLSLGERIKARIASRVNDLLLVANLMDRLVVFVGECIDTQVHGLVTNVAQNIGHNGIVITELLDRVNTVLFLPTEKAINPLLVSSRFQKVATRWRS
jgi:hypothetical protein